MPEQLAPLQGVSSLGHNSPQTLVGIAGCMDETASLGVRELIIVFSFLRLRERRILASTESYLAFRVCSYIQLPHNSSFLPLQLQYQMHLTSALSPSPKHNVTNTDTDRDRDNNRDPTEPRQLHSTAAEPTT